MHYLEMTDQVLAQMLLGAGFARRQLPSGVDGAATAALAAFTWELSQQSKDDFVGAQKERGRSDAAILGRLIQYAGLTKTRVDRATKLVLFDLFDRLHDDEQFKSWFLNEM